LTIELGHSMTQNKPFCLPDLEPVDRIATLTVQGFRPRSRVVIGFGIEVFRAVN
jgi:hypothetical protein